MALLVITLSGCGGGTDDAPEARTAESETAAAAPADATTPATTAPEPVWTRIELGDTFGDGSISAVATDGTQLVAVGRDARSEAAQPAAWRTTDGVRWQRVELPVPDGRVWDAPTLGAGPNGFVAMAQFNPHAIVASEPSGQVAWISSDGERWELIDADAAGLRTAIDVDDVDYVLRFARAHAIVYARQWVAVGNGGWDRSYETGDESFVAWTASDGRAWQRHSANDEPFGGSDNRFGAAVATDGNRIVAGGRSAGGPSPGFLNATLWWSDDGATWNRVPDSPVLVGTNNEEILAVTVGASGWIAAGRDEIGDIDSLDTRAALWFSSDGATWERVRHDDALFGGSGDIVEVHDVIATADGYVAAGTWNGESGTRAAVWTSSDGRTWLRADLGEELSEYSASFDHLVVFGGRLLAFDTEYGVRAWAYGPST